MHNSLFFISREMTFLLLMDKFILIKFNSTVQLLVWFLLKGFYHLYSHCNNLGSSHGRSLRILDGKLFLFCCRLIVNV